MTDEELKYLTNGQLREHIAYTAGCDPSRYGIGTRCGLLKRHVISVAHSVQPDDSGAQPINMDLNELYTTVCEWCGAEHEGNAGCDWKMNRACLKAIYRTIDAQPPREVMTA